MHPKEEAVESIVHAAIVPTAAVGGSAKYPPPVVVMAIPGEVTPPTIL